MIRQRPDECPGAGRPSGASGRPRRAAGAYAWRGTVGVRPPGGRGGGARGRGRVAGARGRRRAVAARPAGGSARPASAVATAFAKPRRCRSTARPACGGRRVVSSAASSSLRAARRCADLDLGLAAISPGVGATARRVNSSASGSWPQTQIGKSGGQMHPRARSARNRLTRRSSSEWNEIAANRPPGAEHVPGDRQRVVELGELVVDRDPQRLEGAAGRMPAGELRRHRHRRLDHLDQLMGRAERLALRRARAIARAICDE